MPDIDYHNDLKDFEMMSKNNLKDFCDSKSAMIEKNLSLI